ncbi:MAG: twin-arginine translocation signal domain-containing protein, partial [Candidatus Tectomicrobia bacterium]|nr:twin-arginine translocation signal domain-containing protein [Candidatus Tectomicrobia bacterium]
MDSRDHAPIGITRRSFLGAAASAAAGLYGLSPGLSEAAIPNVFDGSAFKLQAPEPNPKHGGVLRYGVLS